MGCIQALDILVPRDGGYRPCTDPDRRPAWAVRRNHRRRGRHLDIRISRRQPTWSDRAFSIVDNFADLVSRSRLDCAKSFQARSSSPFDRPETRTHGLSDDGGQHGAAGTRFAGAPVYGRAQRSGGGPADPHVPKISTVRQRSLWLLEPDQSDPGGGVALCVPWIWRGDTARGPGGNRSDGSDGRPNRPGYLSARPRDDGRRARWHGFRAPVRGHIAYAR